MARLAGLGVTDGGAGVRGWPGAAPKGGLCHIRQIPGRRRARSRHQRFPVPDNPPLQVTEGD